MITSSPVNLRREPGESPTAARSAAAVGEHPVTEGPASSLGRPLRTCSGPGCNRPGREAHGLCKRCYNRHESTGQTAFSVPIPDLPGPPASELASGGDYFGRFSWVPRLNSADWLPDPNGSHDAYQYQGSIYLTKVTP